MLRFGIDNLSHLQKINIISRLWYVHGVCIETLGHLTELVTYIVALRRLQTTLLYYQRYILASLIFFDLSIIHYILTVKYMRDTISIIICK